ncbi:MAG: Spx/MgsR family RNA polymerase-binding regulatory protein [Halothiobacillaceae bacterium]
MKNETLKMYGIQSCTTVKKARAWLEQHGIEAEFHDYKKTPITPEQLEAWEARLGWQILLKKTGTTWRALPDELKKDLSRDNDKVLHLLHEHPNLIRRPIVVLHDGRVLAGFDESQYQAAFQPKD